MQIIKRNENIIINNIDDYSFFNLIDFIQFSDNEIDWIKNKCLKVDKYNNLFVFKVKDIWKDLLINIFASNVLDEIEVFLHKEKQINFLKIKPMITDIIDEIRFFTYKTKYFGITLDSTLKIYEYGLYNNLIKNKSVSLLIFYSFFIILNLHEIGGHLYVRMQYFLTLNKKFQSPKIDDYSFFDYSMHYSKYAINKGKESGELIEIKLFDRVVNSLTVKEALYVLNKQNYSQSLDKFKQNFKLCNEKKVESFIDDSMRTLLFNLGIKIDDILEETSNDFYSMNLMKENIPDHYNRNILRHPISFYYDINKVLDIGIEDLKRIISELNKGLSK